MNTAQLRVKENMVNLLILGIKAAGFVTLSDHEIEQVLESIGQDNQ